MLIQESLFEGANKVEKAIDALKTFEPVRRGKWLEGSRAVRVYACSVCGWELYEKTDYCPHCGANMYELEGL